MEKGYGNITGTRQEERFRQNRELYIVSDFCMKSQLLQRKKELEDESLLNI